MSESFAINPARILAMTVENGELRVKFRSGFTWALPVKSIISGDNLGGVHRSLKASPSDMIAGSIAIGGVKFKDGSTLPGYTVCGACNAAYKPGFSNCDCRADARRKQLEAVKPD